MDYRLVFLVYTGTVLSVAFAQTRKYYFVNTTLNWTDAQSFCRLNYTDLATLESITDVEAVSRTTSNYTGLAWIGLFDDLENSWKWSLIDSSFYGDGEYTFRNWDSGQPNNLNGLQLCVVLMSGSLNGGRWDDQECSNLKRFVCYNGTIGGSPSYVISNIHGTWTEAQAFCRENYVDLASVRNQTENNIISNLGNGTFLWIGLYREKLWSDGSTSLFQNWANGQPSHGGEECMAANFNDSGKWHDEDCSLSYPFICYKPIPPNAGGFRASTQDETSISLQWNKIYNNISFVLQFNGTETVISAPAGDGPITHTVSSLTHGTKYSFTLFSVLDGIRSSGVELETATVPLNAEDFRPSAQDDTSITLQWNKINNDTSFVLQFNGTETNIYAPSGDGPVTYTVSYLTAGTYYTFFLLSVVKNIRSSGVQLTALTAPVHPMDFRPYSHDETSITLQWNKINSNTSFVFLFNGTETFISAPTENVPVFHTVSSLTAATRYTFSLFSVFENVTSSSVSITALTAPKNPEGFTAIAQNETSISLRWDRGRNNDSYILYGIYFSRFISAPGGDGPINYTVSYLTPGTRYTIFLYSLFENIVSSGVQLIADTVPQNPDNFRPSTQDETSITLQWDIISSSVSFVLQFNGTETNISTPSGYGPVTHTVSSLSARTKYTFSLFSVFENLRSSGVSITAATGPSIATWAQPYRNPNLSDYVNWNTVYSIMTTNPAPTSEIDGTHLLHYVLLTSLVKSRDYIVALNMKLKSYYALSESEIRALVEEFFLQYDVLPQFSMRVVSVEP